MIIHIRSYNLKCAMLQIIIIHKAVLICNLSAAVMPYNYEQIVTFYSLLKYQLLNLTCDNILQYMYCICNIEMFVILYPNMVW